MAQKSKNYQNYIPKNPQEEKTTDQKAYRKKVHVLKITNLWSILFNFVRSKSFTILEKLSASHPILFQLYNLQLIILRSSLFSTSNCTIDKLRRNILRTSTDDSCVQLFRKLRKNCCELYFHNFQQNFSIFEKWKSPQWNTLPGKLHSIIF